MVFRIFYKRIERYRGHLSLNRHLNVVEGFECSNDPRGYVVWGLNAPGRVSHGKQALGDGSDKESFMRTKISRHMTSPGTAEPGPTLEPGLGLGLAGERLVAGLFLAGPSRAKPERETRGHPPVGPPPAGGTMRDWWRIGWRTKVETSAARSPDA
ncbi:hypothetical protein XENORESO_021873 [Xenotaenia resolanae]|uniref:Uncharacterized protein n=1 Tax=Xenotaenia resolanae TaxID=208358 RepID=A0ABV0WKW4_9TELE